MAILKEERIGGQRLLLGDCREVMPLLGRFDAVITDPPYSVSVAGSRCVGKAGKGSRNLDFFKGDADWPAMTALVADACRLSIESRPMSVVYWCGHRQIGSLVSELDGAGYSTRMLCWRKACPPPAPPGSGFSSAHELAVYAYLPGRHWNGGVYEHNVFDADSYRHGQPGKVAHPTQKPLSLIEWNVRLLTDAGDVILDPFMGSGTTLVACQRMGRMGTGIELDPEYWAIACKRVDEAARQPDMFIAPTPKPEQLDAFK